MVSLTQEILLPLACPVEIWLEIMAFMCTRDIIILSRTCKDLYAIGEMERKKRQDIKRQLLPFVDDVDGFRRLMHKTGGILVGDFAAAFFIGPMLGKVDSLEMVFHNVRVQCCLRSWFSFLRRESMVSPVGLSTTSFMHDKVCFLIEV